MRLPKYRRHPNGSAFLQHKSIDRPGHRLYLGKYGSPQSHERYEEAIRKIRLGESPIAKVSTRKTDVKIAEIAEAYLDHAKDYYRDGAGRQTTEYRRVVGAVGVESPILALFAADNAADFGPVKLGLVRDVWIAQGLARGTVNDYVGLVRRMFRWASSREMIPAATYHGLLALEPLQSGRSAAKETPAVGAVSIEDASKCFPWLRTQCCQMATVQYWSGMRPQDVCRLRGDKIVVLDDVWLYTPESHKNAWRGQSLLKAIPPVAQEILRPLMEQHGDGYLFPTSTKGARSPYCTPDNYWCAVSRAIRKGRDEGHDIPSWSPNQLRHGIGTLVAQQFGHEAASLWLGHKDTDTTKVYIEKQRSELIALAQKVAALAAG